MTFTILGRLESLNQTLKIPRHRFWQSQRRQRMKREIANWILGADVPKFADPVRIHIHWIEKDLRRDLDNIRAGAKLILDALVVMERITNDSRKWVVSLTDSYGTDKKKPRIEVTIEPAAEPMSHGMREKISSNGRGWPEAFNIDKSVGYE